MLTVTREDRQEVDRGQYLAPLLGLMMIMIDGYDLQSIGYVAPEIARARQPYRRVGRPVNERTVVV